MLKVQAGITSGFKFIFTESGQSYDPTAQATPKDVAIVVRRGDFGTGPIIDGPFTYNNQPATPDTDHYFEKLSSGEFTFYYKIPDNLFEGVYSIVATTEGSFGQILNVTMYFAVLPSKNTISSVVISNRPSTIVNERALYGSMSNGRTATVMLVGHADGIPLNEPIKISSVEEAMNFLNADLRSPLVRGILDSYAAGCRDIAICASARMSEYVSEYSERNVSSDIFELSSATPSNKTFYEKYHERLGETYSVLRDHDYIDYIVPLEASIISTGSVDFITQLSNFCSEFHNTTGYVCMGVIGSRTGGFSSGDVDDLEGNAVIANGLTTYTGSSIATDYGRFVIPVYGEAVFKHNQIKSSYTGSIAAAYAGMLSKLPLNVAAIKKKVPGAMFLFGVNLSDAEYSRIESLGVNTAFRSKRTRRSYPYEVYTTNEYTMSHPLSTLKKVAQMRLVSSVIREAKDIASTYVGRFAKDQLESEISLMLKRMKSQGIINDYSYNMYYSKTSRGDVTIDLSLLSSLNLKSIDFSISAGPVA